MSHSVRLLEEVVLPGSGYLRPRHLWVTPEGKRLVSVAMDDVRRRYIRQCHQAYTLDQALCLGVTPRAVSYGDALILDWIEGTAGCTVDHIFTPRGARITILDFLTFMPDRTLDANVVVDMQDGVWAVDYENAFSPPENWGWAGNTFLEFWEVRRPPGVDTMMQDEVALVARFGTDALRALLEDVDVQKDALAGALKRYEILLRTGDIGAAWHEWRTVFDQPIHSPYRPLP